MRCAFCRQEMAYIHGHAACIRSGCPRFGVNQAECCDGETAEAAPVRTSDVAAARALAALADLAPEYLRVVIAVADDLAALEVLLALGAETGKGRAEKRRRTQAAPPKAP